MGAEAHLPSNWQLVPALRGSVSVLKKEEMGRREEGEKGREVLRAPVGDVGLGDLGGAPDEGRDLLFDLLGHAFLLGGC